MGQKGRPNTIIKVQMVSEDKRVEILKNKLEKFHLEDDGVSEESPKRSGLGSHVN